MVGGHADEAEGLADYPLPALGRRVGGVAYEIPTGIDDVVTIPRIESS